MDGAYRRLGAIVGALALCVGCKPHAPPPGAGAPPTVRVAPAERHDVPIVREYVGTLDGYVNVELRARVAGFLEAQHYREGTVVEQGQLLFTIDPRQYQAALSQAKAALARAKATLTNAQVTVKRLRPLAEQRAVSEQDLDTAVAGQQEAAANVLSARAGLEQAELNLSYTRITSPIKGLAGAAEVRVGNLVGQGQPTRLTTVSDVDPIRAVFAVPEREYLEFQRWRSAGGAAQGGPEVRLMLADGSVYPERGELLFAGREVSAATGTLRLEAVFPNPNLLLRPGQYARILLRSQTLKNAVVVPARAVNPLQGLFQVAVVDRSGVAHVKQVQPGPTIGNRQVIAKGLSGGEQVVVDGFAKAKEGQKVKAEPAPPLPEQGPSPSPQGIGGSGPPREPGRDGGG